MHTTACHCCGLIQAADADHDRCGRCRTRLPLHDGAATNTPTAALALSALAFYPLAILSPFLRVEQLGRTLESSLLRGIRSLYEGGHAAVAAIVLVFSVVLPLLKLSALLVLSLSVDWIHARHRALTYRAVEQLGRWGMLDVLLVAVLVAFVKLGDLVEFSVGPGVLLFAAFALLSLLAGVTFNPQLLWDETMDTPTAAPRKPKRRWFWWLLPVAAAVAAGVGGWLLWPERGEAVVVRFDDGRGLAAGDPVRFHGVDVGIVRDVSLTGDAAGVQVELSLGQDAASLAREGTRWWIVRPVLGVAEAEGLETLLGGKYVTLQPGSGPPRRSFVGLERPPLPDLEESGGLTVIAQATAGPRLQPGVGVFHRGVRVGGVTSVGLASDASAVEYEVYIRPRFAPLVNDETEFWSTGGVTFGAGLDGLTVRLDSLSELIGGGIAIATPSVAEPAAKNSRFVLHPEPEDEWLQWRPQLPTPDVSVPLPDVVPVTVSFQETGLLASWGGRTTRSAVAAVDAEGLVLPLSELVPDGATDVRVVFEGKMLDRVGEADPAAFAAPGVVAGKPLAFAPLGVPVDATVLTTDGPKGLAAAQWERDESGFRLPAERSFPDGSPAADDAGRVIAFIVGGRLVPAKE